MIGAFAKLLPPNWRTIGFGAGTAAGSFGQFLFSPLAVGLIGSVGWHNTLLTFAGLVLLILPLSLVVATSPRDNAASAHQQSFREALG